MQQIIERIFIRHMKKMGTDFPVELIATRDERRSGRPYWCVFEQSFGTRHKYGEHKTRHEALEQMRELATKAGVTQ